MRANKIIFFLFSMIFLLTACSVFAPIKVQQNETYVLSQVPAPLVKKSSRATILLVNYPQSSAVYNTTQMAYSTQTFKIDYFSKNQWVDTPSQMLQPLMVQTLQNTHYFREVVSPGMLSQYNVVLNTQLLQFQQVFFNTASEVRIILKAQLVDVNHNNRLIASKEFSVNELASPTPYGGVVAANRGSAKILAQLAQFATQAL
jgi:cholesterol transport system auxiliary component